MKINKYILIFMLILALFFLFYSINRYFISNGVMQTKELDMFLTVSNYTGFNVDTDAIYFGTIPNGGSGKRIILLHNLDVNSEVLIKKEGNFMDWILLEENNFFMEANESKNVSVSVRVPADADYGNYTGKLKIVFKRF